MSFLRRTILGLLLLQPTLAPAAAEQALSAQIVQFDVQRQPMEQALTEFAKQANLRIIFFPEIVKGFVGVRVSGAYTPQDALEILLSVSALSYRFTDARTVAVTTAESSRSESGPPFENISAVAPVRLAQAEISAAPAKADKVDEVEEVVVTSSRPFKPENSEVSTKFPLRLVETPQSISVLTEDLLATVGAHDIFDIDGLVPGLQEQGTSNGFDARFIMRGFPLSREDGIKIDGVSIPNRFILDLAAVERVEVVRGPSSVIYGQTDYGGTMNFVLKRPKLGTRKFAARASAGSHGFSRAMVDATLPLRESAGMRLVGAYEKSDSFVDIANHETKIAAPSFLFNLGERTELFISTYFQERNGQDHLGFGAFAGGVIPDVPRENFLGPAWNSYNSRATQSTAQLRHALADNFDLTFNGAFSDVSNGFLTGFSRVYPDAAGNAPVVRNSDAISRYKTTYAEVVGTWKFAGFGDEPSVLSMTADARTIRGRGASVGGAQPVIGTVNIFDPAGANAIPFVTRPKTLLSESENNLRGVSGTVLLRLPRDVNLMLGGRYGSAVTSTLLFSQGATVGPVNSALTGAKSRNDVFVPKAGITWEFVPNWFAYGTYAEGIIFQFARDFQSSLLPNETGVQQEIGVKAELFNKRLGLSTAVFSIDRENVLTADTTNIGFSTTADAAQHRGFEFEALGQPLPGLNISLNYAFLDVEIEDEAKFGSSQQANVPKHSAGLFFNHEFHPGPLHGLSLGLGTVYVSKRAADSFSKPAAVLPSYTKLDLFASYRFNDKFALGVNAQNVTDEEILVSSFGVDSLGLMYREARSASVTLDVTF